MPLEGKYNETAEMGAGCRGEDAWVRDWVGVGEWVEQKRLGWLGWWVGWWGVGWASVWLSSSRVSWPRMQHI